MTGSGNNDALARLCTDAPLHGVVDHRIHLFGQCGSGELGHHARSCTNCGNQEWLPNACRSAACPFCRRRERMQWASTQEKQLPDVPYFHVVFTVPSEMRTIARLQPRVFYNCLFQASRQALLDICGDPKHLGVTPIAFAVLHTWNRRLHLHPHVHVVISAGGLTPDGVWRWAGETRTNAFLVPQNIVRSRFQTVLINSLLKAYDAGELPRILTPYPKRHVFRSHLVALRKKSWSVHLQRPLNGPQAVIRYLARYVNRIGIAPQRVLSYDGKDVALSWQDRNNNNAPCIDTHTARNFLLMLKQHLPPRRFIRVRFWGLLAHRIRAQSLLAIKAALKTAIAVPVGLAEAVAALAKQRRETADTPAAPIPGPRCRHCGGLLVYDGVHLTAAAFAAIRAQLTPD